MTTKTNLKAYYIKSLHEVYADDFNDGQQMEVISFWDNSAIIKAQNALDAVNKYFEEILYFSFNKDFAHIDTLNGENVLHYSNYVDSDNCECEIGDNSEKMQQFKRAEIQLLVADTYLEIFELSPAKL